MNRFSITVDIAAPPQRAWGVLSDGPRWPEWTPSVTSIKLLDPGPLRVGTRALIRQPKLPPAVWKVTELDEGRSFTWVTGSPLVRVTARHTVETIEGGSRVTLSLHFSGLLGSLVARLTHNLNQRYLALEANGLKQRVESSGSSSAS